VKPARWIDVGAMDPIAFHATYAGLADAQEADAAPVVVWGQARTHLCLGQSQGRCDVGRRADVPVVRRPLGGGAVWVDENQLSYALVAPLGLAPPRHEDWYAWALAPAIATFRSFGLDVERRAEDLWLAGRKIAGSGAATIGRCAVVASSFLLKFPREHFAASVASPDPAFRAALDDALSAAMTDWSSHAAPPDDDSLATAFRAALRATLGWSAVASPIRASECAAIEAWRDELAAPIEAGRPRVAGGIKLNAALTLRRDARTGAPRLERTPAR
jgi:lipoate-protein ligase A